MITIRIFSLKKAFSKKDVSLDTSSITMIRIFWSLSEIFTQSSEQY